MASGQLQSSEQGDDFASDSHAASSSAHLLPLALSCPSPALRSILSLRYTARATGALLSWAQLERCSLTPRTAVEREGEGVALELSWQSNGRHVVLV